MMNRIAILVLGLGLAAAALEKTAFLPGTEYVYDYEGQAATGLPDSSKTFSGLKIRAKLRIQVKYAGEFILKPEQVKVMFFNGELPTAELPVAQLPIELFTPLTGEPRQLMEEWLMKPVVFRYQQGIVSNVRASAEEPFWSLNIKRGILSILQININGVDRVKDNLAQTISNRLNSQSESKYFFKAMEESVHGECETLYHISRLPSVFTPQDQQVMNISKTINHKKCLNAPAYFNSVIKGLRLPENISQAKLLSMGTEVNYNITGERTNFLVESAEVLGQQVFTPLNKEKGSAVTFTNQILRLAHVMKIQTAIVMPTAISPLTNGLVMYLPEVQKVQRVVNQFSHGYTVYAGVPQGINRPEAVTLINMIADATGDRLAKVPQVIIKLMKVLRGASLEDLRSICDQYVTVVSSSLNDRQLIIRNVLLDVLPAIGSKASIDYIKSLLTQNKLEMSDRVAQLFSTVALITKPDHALVDTIKSVCELPVVSRDVQMKRTCWLAWSALARQLVIQKEQNPSSNINLRSLWTDIKNIWKGQNTEEEKLLALKVIGNIGLIESVELLSSVIHEPAMTRMLRVQAVYSLRHLARVIPTKVRTILMSMFTNPKERTELRVACCKIIIDSMPSPAMLQLIAQSLLRETNLHVASFIYSHMRSVSESTLPSMRKLATDIKFALRFAKSINPGVHYPKFVHMPMYSENLRFGAALDLSYVPTEKSIFPQSGHLRLNTHVLGYDINVFEAGLYTEGLQTLVEKFLGPYGSLRTSKSPFDVLKPRVKRSSPPVEESINSIKSKLNVKARQPEAPKGSVYIKMFGSELRFFTLGKDFISNIMKEGKVSIKDMETELRNGKSINIQKTIILEDGILKVPTMLGLPLTLNLTAAAHVHVQGQVNATVTPSLFKIKRPGQAPTQVVLGVGMTPKVIVNVIATMGIHTPFIRTGAVLRVLVHSSAPLSAKYTLDIATRNNKVVIDTYSQPQTIFSIVSEPVCVVKYLPNLQTQSNWIIKEQPIKNVIQPIVEDTVVIGKNSIGHSEFHIYYKVPKMTSPIRSGDSNMWPVTTKQQLTITARPPVRPAKQILIEVSYKDKMPQAGKQQPHGSLLWSLFGEGSQKTPSDLPSAPGFRQVTSPVKLTNPSERQILATISAVGDVQEARMVKVQYVQQVDEEGLIRTWDLQMIRSPIPNHDTKTYKICLAAHMKFPKLPQSFTSPISLALARIQTEARIQYGEECDDQQQIQVTDATIKSSEQSRMEQDSAVIRQWPEYIQCTKDSASLLKYTPACINLMERLSQLMSTQLQVTYRPVTIARWVRNYLHDYMNYALRYDYMLPKVILSNQELIERTQNGTVNLNISMSQIRPWRMQPSRMSPISSLMDVSELYSIVNVSLATPSMARQITAQLPIPVSLSARTWFFTRAVRYLANNNLPAVCQVHGNTVRTFDKVVYDIPQVECDTLVVSDCSPDARFMVTIAKAPNSAMKILKVFIEEQKIHIIPSGSSMLVKVNGETRPISPDPFILRQVPSDSSSPIILKIFSDGSFVKVQAPLSLIDIHFTGLEAMVMASPLYFGKTCGLCGDFNGEQTNEFKAPTKAILQKPEHMAMSYLIPGPHCDAEAIKQQYGYDISSAGSSCSKVLKNQIVTRQIHGEMKKCFSTTGVQQCPAQCSAQSLSGKQLVGFRCLSAQDPDTENLLEEVVNSSRPLKKLETEDVDIQEEIDRIQSCGPSTFY